MTDPVKQMQGHDRDNLGNTTALTKPVNTAVLSSMCGIDLYTVACCGLLYGPVPLFIDSFCKGSLKVLEHLMSLYETSLSCFTRVG
jgi:hypothetical protein